MKLMYLKSWSLGFILFIISMILYKLLNKPEKYRKYYRNCSKIFLPTLFYALSNEHLSDRFLWLQLVKSSKNCFSRTGLFGSCLAPEVKRSSLGLFGCFWALTWQKLDLILWTRKKLQELTNWVLPDDLQLAAKLFELLR